MPALRIWSKPPFGAALERAYHHFKALNSWQSHEGHLARNGGVTDSCSSTELQGSTEELLVSKWRRQQTYTALKYPRLVTGPQCRLHRVQHLQEPLRAIAAVPTLSHAAHAAPHIAQHPPCKQPLLG